jgi:hypothetical protein
MPLNRPWESSLPPPAAFKTYVLASPSDATVKAACEQVDCAAWRHGWRTMVDETTDLGREQAAHIRLRARRTFTERPGPGGLTEFLFDSGQRCFADHRTRPEVYGVRGGDWRATTGALRRHANGWDWIDDFGEHQQRVADSAARG